MNRKFIFILFLLLCLAQLLVPAKMIFDLEKVLEEGTTFKFKTAPVDPADPFRGRYITLHFSGNTIELEDSTIWNTGDEVYVKIKEDANGFAVMEEILKTKPGEEEHYFYTNIQYSYWAENDKKMVVVEFPFTRFYMEESKAQEAENAYLEALGDSVETYALVNIKNGSAVLKDVYLNNKSISSW